MNLSNKQQQEVIDCTSNKILVLAGAGAGKTYTMLSRISKLIEVDDVRPQSILVLTFTNKAAFDMKDRYKQSHPATIIPEFRTFHSFCYHLIVTDTSVRQALGYLQVPTVADTNQLKRVQVEAKLQSGVKLSDAVLSGKEKLLGMKEQKELEIYKRCLNRLLKSHNLITFDILAKEVSMLFTNKNTIVDKYKSKYKYIFVDEFQDTDISQVRFIGSFSDAHFCVFGDCIQNIYAFRGCTNEVIKLLAKDDAWTKIRLFENYRSTTNICQFANNMSTYTDPSYRIEMHGQRDGDRVEVIPGSRVTWNEPVDSQHIRILLDKLREKKESNSVAILCRTNNEVKYICDILKSNSILYSSGKRNEDALNILKSIHDNEYMLDWLASFLTAEKYAEFIKLAAQEENPDIKWFAKTYGSVAGIKERGKSIIDIRNILKRKEPVVTQVADILKVLGIRSGQLTEITQPEAIVPTLIDTIEAQGDQDIYVGTIHSSKGLEYDTVYVMGVNDKSFQLRSEEDHNLYYVAITRAKDHLVVFKA